MYRDFFFGCKVLKFLNKNIYRHVYCSKTLVVGTQVILMTLEWSENLEVLAKVATRESKHWPNIEV